jgi:CheY-like chemotaxis protein
MRRIADNEADFRDLNEGVRSSAATQDAGLVGFVCECGLRACHARMELSLDEYEKIRSAGARFAVRDETHVLLEAESVVEIFDRYVVVEKHSECRPVVEARDPRQHAKRCRVLIVDDIVEIRLLLKMLLQLEPTCTVVGEAGNGAEAIDAVTETDPDIVILDLQMPVMDGWEALPAIVKLLPHGKVIVFTSEHADVRRLAKLGAFDYVPKGGDPTVIVQAITEAALSGADHGRRLSATLPR